MLHSVRAHDSRLLLDDPPPDQVVDLSIVIVNWNTGPLLGQCVHSILDHADGLVLEIIVVDNASGDDSMAMLPDDPQVARLLNRRNEGFARANNQGFGLAHGRYLLLLNPDTVVLPDALQRMVEFMDSHPEAGALGPRLLNPDGTLQHSCSYFPSVRGVVAESLGLNRVFPRSRMLSQSFMTHWDHDQTCRVDQPSGACLLVRSEALQQAGVLDERFFVYLEEVDLCYRLAHAGWAIYFLAEAQIIHYGGQSSIHNLDVRIVQRYRSLLRYFAKHFALPAVVLVRGLIVLQMGLRLLMLPLLHRRLQQRRRSVLSPGDLAYYYLRVIRLCLSEPLTSTPTATR